jgi:hypothetical protein
MPIDEFATDLIVFRRNDEAIGEFLKLGYKFPSAITAVLEAIDGRRTFKQIVNDPKVKVEPKANGAIRSLLKLGFVEALPVDATARSRASAWAKVVSPTTPSAANAATTNSDGDYPDDPQLNVTQRLRMVAVTKDASLAPQNVAPAQIGQSKHSEDLVAAHLAEIKTTLLAELTRTLGRDVFLIQPKIEAVKSVEALFDAVRECAYVLEVAISKQASEAFVETFRKQF